MTDHTWATEQIAAAAAGGLSAEESERLDAHARDCPACTAALAEARTLDRRLGSLFSDVRPGPALEDRAVAAVRAARTRRLMLAGWQRKLAVGVAASVGLGLAGGTVGMMDEGELPLPGQSDAAGRVWRERDDVTALAKGTRNAASAAIYGNAGLNTAVRPPSSQSQGSASTIDPAAMARNLAERATGRFGEAEGEQQRYRNYSLSGVRDELNAAVDLDSVQPSLKAYTSPQPPGPGRGGPGTPHDSAPKDATYSYRSIQLPTDASGGQPGSLGLGFFSPTDYPPKYSEQSAGKKGLPDTLAAIDPNRPNAPQATANQKPADPAPAPTPAVGRKIVIRSGDIEFEVESFDAAVASVTKLIAGITGGYVGTVNSEKLPNGKVRGAVVVRVPPEHLDSLVLDLRRDLGKGGELKGLRIASQDITKQYTDLESRLKAARTMEERLIKIIKDGKGEIKQLLEAEKELGVWRTKIEEFEGELRYFGSLAALSTLTITLAEKDIRVAASLTETERVQAGVEVEDVDKAYQQTLAAVTESKGRVTKSELKQLAAGQFNATLHFEVAPDAAGPVRDRLRQIGRVARLEIDRGQQAEGGTPPKDAKVKRGDTVFLVQLYNLANVAPRETAVLQVAVPDVPAAYQALRDTVAKAGGRVHAARLDEQDRQNVTAQFDFEVKRADEPAVQAALAAAGETVSRNVGRAPEGDNVTDTKVLFRTTLIGAARLRPRETTTLALEVADVDGTAAVYAAQVGEAKGRQVDSQIAHEPNGRVTARLVYDVPLGVAPAVVEKFKSAGTVRVQQSARDRQAPDGRYATARIDVTLSNAELIVPRDDGLWPQIRKGLAYSVSVLLTSVTWVVFGLCVVLPWAVVGYTGYRIARRLFRPASPTPVPAG